MRYSSWNVPEVNSEAVRLLTQQGISGCVAASALVARGYDTPEKALQLLNCGKSGLHDPFLMKDMDKAVSRIEGAVKNGEQICVYGDYDVDGITSVSILVDYLGSRGAACDYYIPDRLAEGYGLNEGAVRKIAESGARLIITVDLGITACEEAELCKELGVDIIITDHHECKPDLPCAVAVVNPLRPDCGYPFKHLAGCGVVLKLVCALAGEISGEIFDRYCGLCAIGTIADVMNVLGENRAIIACGMRALEAAQSPGIMSLFRQAGVKVRRIPSSVIGFTIAPRINAAGRMGTTRKAVELLLTDDLKKAGELAADLCDLNRKRQIIENGIIEETVERAMASEPPGGHRAIVFESRQWHQGVVGIVASRLSERFYCPVFLICVEDGVGKGSARSFGGFNIFDALSSCGDLLESFGGHKYAAGFVIKEEHIDVFRERICGLASDFVPMWEDKELYTDGELFPADITASSVFELDGLEPFGAGNRQPVFVLRDAEIGSLAAIGGGRHLRFCAKVMGRRFECVLFSQTVSEFELCEGDSGDIAFSLEINDFRGESNVQLLICDVRQCERDREEIQRQEKLYADFRDGRIDRADAGKLYPRRVDFIAVWRFIRQLEKSRTVKYPFGRMCREVFGADVTAVYARMLICLDVFMEHGLIEYTVSDNRLTVYQNGFDGKVDLNDSMILSRLREFCGAR